LIRGSAAPGSAAPELREAHIVEWNDRFVTNGFVGRWALLAFTLPAGDLHTHELRIIGSRIQVRALEVTIDTEKTVAN